MGDDKINVLVVDDQGQGEKPKDVQATGHRYINMVQMFWADLKIKEGTTKKVLMFQMTDPIGNVYITAMHTLPAYEQAISKALGRVMPMTMQFDKVPIEGK